MRIHKIKRSLKDGRIFIAYEEPNKKGDVNDYTLNCHEAPASSFIRAFDALVQHVLAMCELPESYELGLRVSGVSFSYLGDDGIMGATITAQKELSDSNSPLILNTPFKASAEIKEGDESPTLTSDCVLELYELQHQAEQYVHGVRMQLKLDLEGEEAPKKGSGSRKAKVLA